MTGLLLGMGNEERGDDGLGPAIARSIHREFGDSHWVRTDILHKLDVSLAPQIARIDMLIVVDARHDGDEVDLQLEDVEPSFELDRSPHSTHMLNLPDLLAMARDWYERAPKCFAIYPKGYSFNLGEGLSDQAEQNALAAQTKIKQLISWFGMMEGSTT